jgi:glycine/D-amino acid oxidase-like deaminating enzyme
MKYDYLIVGQGLAGSVLAWTLTQRGYQVFIINNSTRPSSSKVAGGIFNPLTGKKLVQTWKADELFPFARRFYTELEQSLGTELIHFRNMYRPYRSIKEQNDYVAFTSDMAIEKYVVDNPNDANYGQYVQNPYGGLEITQSGWVNVPELLKKIMSFYIEKKQYQECDFNYKKIDFQIDKVIYENLEVKKILFCEGVEARENPFFSWLPFNPVKGQTLQVQIDDYHMVEIINQGAWILPVDGSGLCRIGATYSWHDLDWQTTEDGRAYLIDKVGAFLKKPYRIINQQAGIRPATKDRRPLLGLHPEYPQLGIFNGLGSKGVTLAPFFANQFAQFLENEKDLLDSLVNINRFFPLYYVNKKNEA